MHSKSDPYPEEVHKICDFYGLSLKDICGPQRKTKDITKVRILVIQAMLKDYTPYQTSKMLKLSNTAIQRSVVSMKNNPELLKEYKNIMK